MTDPREVLFQCLRRMEDLLAQARTLVNRWDHARELPQTLQGLARVHREFQAVLDKAEAARKGAGAS